jgi:hypothetical protein
VNYGRTWNPYSQISPRKLRLEKVGYDSLNFWSRAAHRKSWVLELMSRFYDNREWESNNLHSLSYPLLFHLFHYHVGDLQSPEINSNHGPRINKLSRYTTIIVGLVDHNRLLVYIIPSNYYDTKLLSGLWITTIILIDRKDTWDLSHTEYTIRLSFLIITTFSHQLKEPWFSMDNPAPKVKKFIQS